MLREEPHISDQELLPAADGELASRGAAQVKAHLLACWSCRARMANIERAITDFVGAHREMNEFKLPPRSRSVCTASS